jgi:hypothetical protein
MPSKASQQKVLSRHLSRIRGMLVPVIGRVMASVLFMLPWVAPHCVAQMAFVPGVTLRGVKACGG